MVYDLPPELRDAAREILNETPETKAAALIAIRSKLAEMNYAPYRSDDDFFLRFLRQKKFRVPDAAESCRLYCDFLLENRAVFEGASWEETAAVFPTMGTMFLPDKDVNGRYTNLVLPQKMRFVQTDLDNPEEYGKRQLRASLYLWELWLDDPNLQVHGVNVVQNFEGFSLSATMSMQKVLTPELQRLKLGFLKVSPLRLASICILEQPWYVTVMMSVVKPFLSSKLRKRIHSWGSEWHKLFAMHPPEQLPSEFHGTGHVKWDPQLEPKFSRHTRVILPW
jgi:retinaldehyde-binding protein 1